MKQKLKLPLLLAMLFLCGGIAGLPVTTCKAQSVYYANLHRKHFDKEMKRHRAPEKNLGSVTVVNNTLYFSFTSEIEEATIRVTKDGFTIFCEYYSKIDKAMEASLSDLGIGYYIIEIATPTEDPYLSGEIYIQQ